MRGARAKPKAGFQFDLQKQPVLESSGASLMKKPHLNREPDGYQGGRKSAGGVSINTTDSRKKGCHGEWCS